jgi:hypothetical protein
MACVNDPTPTRPTHVEHFRLIEFILVHEIIEFLLPLQLTFVLLLLILFLLILILSKAHDLELVEEGGAREEGSSRLHLLCGRGGGRGRGRGR